MLFFNQNKFGFPCLTPINLIKIFQVDDGKTEIQVVVQADTVWLSQRQLADLFEKDSDTIGLHFRNIYKSGELSEEATTEKYSVVQKEGTRNVNRNLKLYNLDAIISVGSKFPESDGYILYSTGTMLLYDVF